MSTTEQGVLIMLALFAAYGVVGRMDYEDARHAAQARADAAVRLLCWRTPAGPVHGAAPGASGRAVQVLHVQSSGSDAPLAQASELRCLVLND